ncbi:MAG TPA: DUF4282 domain-containing protein [Hanamia sp.]|nr:DUF4282 domain-containing protein [Hanamia sp.]
MQQQIFIQTNSPNNKGFSWSEFFSFRKMITLQVIQVVYFIIAGLITLGGIITLFSGNSLPGGFFTGLAILIFGNILWRIWGELIIIFFRINNTLSDIDDHTKTEHP